MNIPERLARFAVRHGMWGFVKKMGPCSREFIKERRARVDSVCKSIHANGPGSPAVSTSNSAALCLDGCFRISREHNLSQKGLPTLCAVGLQGPAGTLTDLLWLDGTV